MDIWLERELEALHCLKGLGFSHKEIADFLGKPVDVVRVESKKNGYYKTWIKDIEDKILPKIQALYSKIDPKSVGRINEELAKAKLTLEGFMVLNSIKNNHITDLVILLNGLPIRIQVKTAFYREQTKVFYSRLHRPKGIPYENKDVDFFIIKCNGIEEYYVIPFAVSLKHKRIGLFPHREKLYTRVNLEIYKNNFDLIRMFNPAN